MLQGEEERAQMEAELAAAVRERQDKLEAGPMASQPSDTRPGRWALIASGRLETPNS